MHASVLSGNQHYHSMAHQILADLSKAFINTILAGKKKTLKPSTESHPQGAGLEKKKTMSKHF